MKLGSHPLCSGVIGSTIQTNAGWSSIVVKGLSDLRTVDQAVFSSRPLTMKVRTSSQEAK